MLPNMSQLLLLWLPGKGEIPSSLPAVAPCMPCSLVKHPPLPLSPIPLAKESAGVMHWYHALHDTALGEARMPFNLSLKR